MFNKKFMFLAIFLVGILAISAVSADDNVTDDVVGTDADENIIENTNDDVYSISDDFKNKSTFGGLVYNLKNYTAEGVVYLDKDYKFVGPEYELDPITGKQTLVVDEKGITIDRNLTIYGNGHIIDANNSARFFYVTAHNVVFKDIVFVNGKDIEWNSPIVWEGNGGIVDNCTFYNCKVDCDGGVFAWSGDGGRITDCNFTDCYAINAGAILWSGNDGTVSNSNFDNCSSHNGAGSIKWTGQRGNVDGCTFTNGQVIKGNGGAIVWEGANGTVTNSNFVNITTFSVGLGTGGGAIYWSGDNPVISKSKFKNTSVNWNGGAINLHNANATVTDCSFFNCTAGGAVYVHSPNGTVLNSNFTNCYEAIHLNNVNGTVKNSNFFNCTTTNSGGAILVLASNCTVSDSNFVNCNSTRRGSAIGWSGDNGTLTGCTFEKCYVNDYGAVHWTGNNATISDSNFTDCFACGANGGAVGISGTYKTFTILNSNFFNCFAANDGGAIYWQAGNGNVYTMKNSNFFNCSANRYGGAISGPVNVYDSTFEECSAGQSGGAMYGGSATNCNFTNNKAKWGGAKYSSNGPSVNCVFIGNTADDNGGAVYFDSIINCTFVDNYAKGRDGGALYSVQNVLNSNFTNCHANSSGGAIYKADSVINCSFNNCSSANEGGAIRWDGYQGLVNNSNFNDCSAAMGGAIYWSGNAGLISNSNFTRCAASENGGAVKGANVVNCSFVENHAEGRGGAMYGGSARDCTFWYNTAAQGNNWDDTKVPKLNLNVVNFNSVYGSGDAIFLNATEGDVAVNDVIITITVSKNGTEVAKFDRLTNTEWIVDLGAGSYKAKMTVEHHAYELDKQITLTIEKLATNVTASDISTVYNKGDLLVATLKDVKGNPLANQVVAVDLNGVGNYTTDENGTIEVSTKGIDCGNYTAALTFAGSDNYSASNATVNVSVQKAATSITAPAVTTVYNGGKYLYVTLIDEFGNPISGVKVSININGAKPVTTDKDGKAKLTTNGYAPKTSYTAKINFAGNGNYIASSKTAKVTIKKATVKLTAKAKSFKRSDKTKKYTITLKDNNNKVMKNTKVTIKVNKKTYSAKTNSKGVATFKLTKLTKKGKYTATVKYAATKYYNAKTVKPKITVK